MAEEQIIQKEHQQIVDEVQGIVIRIGGALRRPQMIYNALYHPDLVATVDGKRFIPIEVINSSYGFDVLGILSLTLTKDIIDNALIIVTDKMYNQAPDKFKEVCDLIEKFRKYSNSIYGNNLVILREHEVEGWFKSKIKESGLWSENL